MNKYKYLVAYAAIAVLIGLNFAKEVDSTYSKKENTTIRIISNTYIYYGGSYRGSVKNVEATINEPIRSKDSIVIRFYAVPLNSEKDSYDQINRTYRSEWLTIKKTRTIKMSDYNLPDLKNVRWGITFLEAEDFGASDNGDIGFIKFDIIE